MISQFESIDFTVFHVTLSKVFRKEVYKKQIDHTQF